MRAPLPKPSVEPTLGGILKSCAIGPAGNRVVTHVQVAVRQVTVIRE